MLQRCFRRAKDIVAPVHPEIRDLKLWIGCPEVEAAHRRDFRSHMHVGHRDNHVCVARDAATLPPANLAGLFLHEIGHLIGGPSQFDADIAIFEGFGIPILYDDRMIQYVEI